MSGTKAAFALTLFLFVLCIPAYPQAASTYHVFPQVADGSFSDGTYYRSVVYATNMTSANAACNYQLYGLGADRLQTGDTLVALFARGVIRISTTGNALPFVSGYAVLACDQPIQAYIQFEYISPVSGVLGTATVFSAPATTAAEFIFPTGSGYRLGLAIANDSDIPAQLSVRVGASGAGEVRASVTVAPHTKIAKFVEELVTIPAGFVPVAVLVEPADATTPRFRAIGLVFWGTVFSTAPPLVYTP
jgi:hypothetical protein